MYEEIHETMYRSSLDHSIMHEGTNSKILKPLWKRLLKQLLTL